MIILSPQLAAALGSTANQPVDLYELHLASGVKYYADQQITWGGNTYLPLVRSRSAIKRYDGGQFDSVSIELDNVNTGIAQLLLGEEIEGCRIIIRKVDRTVAADSLVLFNGRLERVSDIDEETATISATQLIGSIDHDCPSRRFGVPCGWKFKSWECGYAGPEVDCNKSWARCSQLGRTNNYGGFRFVPHSGTFQYQEVTKKRFLLLFSRKSTKTITATYNAVDDTPYDVPIPIVLGRVQIVGIPIQHVDEGGQTKILAALAVGVCQGMTYPRANGALVASWTPHHGQPAGEGTQTVDSRFPQSYPYHLCCYIGITVPSEVSAEDPAPTVDCVLQGQVVDFYNSSGTWTHFAWSDNPAWNVLRYMTLPLEQGGMGLPLETFDLAALHQTAQYCDELIVDASNDQKIYEPVNLPDGWSAGAEYRRYQSTGVNGVDPLDDGPYAEYQPGVDDDTSTSPVTVMVKRFTLNIAIAKAEKAVDVLYKKLLPSFRGYITYSKDGRIQIRSERPVANTTITTAAAAGVTQILCTTPSQFNAGQKVLIGALTVSAEVRTISSVLSDRITLTAPTLNAHAAGQRIHFVCMVFDDTNTIGKIQYPLRDRQPNANRITVKYCDAPAGFEPREIQVNDYEHQAQVHRINNEDVDGSAIDNYSQAWRIAHWMRTKMRDLGRFVSLRGDISASVLEIGDVIAVTTTEHGLSCVPFRVVEFGHEPDDEVSIVAQLYSIDAYSDTAPQATVTVPGVFTPILPGGVGPALAPTDVTLTVTDEQSNRYGLQVAWNKPDAKAGVVGYELRVQYYTDINGLIPAGDITTLAPVTAYETEAATYGPYPRDLAARSARALVAGYNAAGDMSEFVASNLALIDPGVPVALPVPGDIGPDDWILHQPDPDQGDFWNSLAGDPIARLRTEIVNFPGNTVGVKTFIKCDGVWTDPAAWVSAPGPLHIAMPMPLDGAATTWPILPLAFNEWHHPVPTDDHPAIKLAYIPARLTASAPADWTITIVDQVIAGTKYGQYRIALAGLNLATNPLLWWVVVERRWANATFTEFTGWQDTFSVHRSQIASWEAAVAIDPTVPFPLGNLGDDRWPYTDDATYIEWRISVETPDRTRVYSPVVKQVTTAPGGGFHIADIAPSLGSNITIKDDQLVATVAGTINEDFEDDFRGWSAVYPAQVSIITGADAYAGKSCRIAANASASNVIYQDYPAVPGDVKRLRVHAKSTANGAGRISLFFLDVAKTVLTSVSTTVPAPTAAYQPFIAQLTAPANTAYVRIAAGLDGTATTGAMFVDQVSLEALEAVSGGLTRDQQTLVVQDLGITTAKLANLAATEAKLAALAVTFAKLASAAVGGSKLMIGGIDNHQYIGDGVLARSAMFANAVIVNAAIQNLDAVKVTSGEFNGRTLFLNLNGVITEIRNLYDATLGAYGGIRVSGALGSYHRTVITAGGIACINNNGYATVGIVGGNASSVMDGAIGLSQYNGTQTLALYANFGGSAGPQIHLASQKVVGIRGSAVTRPTGGSVVDVQVRAALNDLIDRLSATFGHGLIAN